MDLEAAVRAAAEERRVHALHALGVLDDEPRRELATIVRLAARTSGTGHAAVNLIDADRQWPAAVHGGGSLHGARQDSLCGRTIDAGLDTVHTADASAHPLFADSPFVIGPLGGIRTYAAAVVRSSEGLALGTLCAFSSEAVAIDERQLASLADLAQSTGDLLDLDRRALQLARLATVDGLTGVLNRRGFDDVLDRLSSQAARGRLRPGALLLDLDGFKGVNDSLGHAAGDDLLRIVAGRLVTAARREDVVSRLGGDELAVLVPDTDEGEIEVVRRRLVEAVGVPVVVGGAVVTPRASCGSAVWRGREDSAADLVARADADMYAAKTGLRTPRAG